MAPTVDDICIDPEVSVINVLLAEMTLPVSAEMFMSCSLVFF